MPLLIVAGFKAEHVREMKKRGAGGIRDGWDVHYVVSDDPRPLLGFKSVKPVIQAAALSQQSHVLAVSEDGSRRAEISAQIRQYFRFRWLSNDSVAAAKRDRFSGWVAALQPVLEEEEDWARVVKPSSAIDALMLPQRAFGHDHLRMDIWGACEAYNSPNAVRDAATAISRFSTRHLRSVPSDGNRASKQLWVDDAEVKFDHRGPRHGVAPFPRGWKYSYQSEDGFHYDVSHLSGRKFKLQGTRSTHGVETGGYRNMDCHGYFRGEAID